MNSFSSKQRGIEGIAKRERPEGDEVATVDHAVGGSVEIGKEEADDNVEKKSELASDVQEEKVLW